MKVTPIGSNRTEVRIGSIRVLISYETPVAAYFYDKAEKINRIDFAAENCWTPVDEGDQPFWREKVKSSATTSKHINKWFREIRDELEDTLGRMPDGEGGRRAVYEASHEEIADLLKPKQEGISLEVSL